MGKQKFTKEFDVDVEFPQEESPVPIEVVPSAIEVEVINWDLGDSALVKGLVSGQFRIISKEHLKHAYGAQSIPFHYFRDGIVPYDWQDEINALALTPDMMREILYAQGFVAQQELNLAELTKKLLVRGKAPVMRRI